MVKETRVSSRSRESSRFAHPLITLLDVDMVLCSPQTVSCAASAGEKDYAHSEFRPLQTITFHTSFDLPGLLGTAHFTVPLFDACKEGSRDFLVLIGHPTVRSRASLVANRATACARQERGP